MKTWSLYDSETGDFTGVRVSGPNDAFVQLHTPAGKGAVLGSHDRYTKRVVDGRVIDRPEPLAQPERAQSILQQQITHLEAQQARPLRELALDPDNVRARNMLESIEARITALRDSME